MNEVLNAILTRRSVRSYKPDPVPEDVLERILTAGQYAATGMNRQSPIILAVSNKAMRDKLSAMNAEIMGSSGDPFYGAPVVLVVLYLLFAMLIPQLVDSVTTLISNLETYYNQIYAWVTNLLEKNPEIVQGFVNALQKGMDYVNTHTAEEIAKIIKPQFKENDLDTITTIVKRYKDQDTWKDNLIFEKDSFDLLQDILDSAGELKARVAYSDLVITDYAETAAK